MSSEPIGLVHEEDSVEGVHVLDLDVDEEAGTNLKGRASGSVKRKRPLKSQWWQYFEMLPEVEGEEKRCKCKACGTTYKADSSMGTAYQFRYPELAQMTRDILSVPISTVASESAFSTGGRILDQYRSAMKPDVVEALVCCRDWLVGQKETTEVRLDNLTENVTNLFIKEDVRSNNAATDD
ncbi:uncharacterized protein LOC142530666 [Primulina tabacum]|uniref:uncharacterized protein LOC142530666 n=1 Tax=Primulina tabacum TaxID=48773 RepID=UPI003F5ACCA5